MSTKELKMMARRLLQIRIQRNWTQPQMARVIGISVSRLSCAEAGKLAFKTGRARSLVLIRNFLEGV
jgi:transcriptional regulator with XRE-family HTH domain